MASKLRTWLLVLARHPLTPSALITVAAGLLLVTLTPLQDLSYDLSFRTKPRAAITNVVLISANQETLKNLGDEHGYVKRTEHARLLDRLAQERAKLVFYDFVFSESNQVAEVDQTLARAIRNQGSVILVATADDSTEHDVALKTALSPPIPILAQAARGWGHAELFGNIVREISGDFYTNYAVWVAATKLEPEKFAREDPNRARWLNYYGRPGSGAIPHCSFEDAISNNVPPGFLAEKIVFVGQSFPVEKAQKFQDAFATPYSVPTFLLSSKPMPGVEIHATALLNLIRGNWLRLAPLGWQWLAAAVWGIVTVKTFFVLRRKSKMLALVGALGGALLLWIVSLYVQWRFHVFWAWVGPVFLQTAAALVLVGRIPKTDPYVAFISYRTEEDGAAALLTARSLSERGYKTFLDVRSLTAGYFDEQLLREIENATFFVLILSPNSLARCVNADDWVLRELTHALSKQKPVIPIFKSGFSFDAKQGIPDLPQLAELRRFQGVSYSNANFDGYLEKLMELLRQKG